MLNILNRYMDHFCRGLFDKFCLIIELFDVKKL